MKNEFSKMSDRCPSGQFECLDPGRLTGWVALPSGFADPVSIVVDGVEAVVLDPAELVPERRGARFELNLATLAARLALPSRPLADNRWHAVALLAGETELDHRALFFGDACEGWIEHASNDRVEGWACDASACDEPVTLNLTVEGIPFEVCAAAIDRPDLAAAGKTSKGGGFRIPLPRWAPAAVDPLRIGVRAGAARTFLPAGEFAATGVPARARSWSRLLDTLAPEPPPVTIVTPIYNAPRELAECLEWLVRHTSAPARLLLIDDASPDPRVGVVLSSYRDRPGVTILRNRRNLGYTRTVNLALGRIERDDVVLLNADTIVHPGWLDGLRAAAYSGRTVGTATAISNNAGAFSVPEVERANPCPPALSGDEWARRVRQIALALYPQTPTGNGFCLYIRRNCLEATGAFDESAFPRGYGEENDFCMRAAGKGFVHVVDDRTLVSHRRSASFGSERTPLIENAARALDQRYPDYAASVADFGCDLDMTIMRWRIRRAAAEARRRSDPPRPRVLYVISTQTGGTPQTNRDLMRALADRYEPWVLHCDATTLTLARYREEGDLTVETHRLERPVSLVRHRSEPYDDCVADLLLRQAIELVHVRHIAWHSLGLPAVCRRLGIPVVWSFHDYYCVCPTTTLLDERAAWCGGACTEAEGECVVSLWPSERVPPLKRRFVHRWRDIMAEALAHCDAFVTTSEAARATIASNFPSSRAAVFRVIPHGRDFATCSRLAAPVEDGEPLRVLAPGNMDFHKGAQVFQALATLGRGRVEIHVLGEPGTLTPSPGLVLHGPYRREAFAGHVAGIRPHIGAVFSIWPETYCHTLTEMWACGLPVVGFDLGAVGERIARHGAGWLLDRWIEPEALLEFLLDLRHRPGELKAKTREALAWQVGYGRRYGTAAMAAAYDQLYREAFEARRAFRSPDGREAHLHPRTVLVPAASPAENGAAAMAEAERISEPVRNRVERPIVYCAIDPECRPERLPEEFSAASMIESCAKGRKAFRSLALPEPDPFGLPRRFWGLDPEDPPDAAAPGESDRLRALCFSSGRRDRNLELIRPAFQELAATGVCALHVLGGDPVEATWFEAVAWPADLSDYPALVAWFLALSRGFDIGVSARRADADPGDPDPVRFMAAGLATLISDAGPWRDGLCALGAIAVETTTASWVAAVTRLRGSPAARRVAASRALYRVRKRMIGEAEDADFDRRARVALDRAVVRAPVLRRPAARASLCT